MLGLAGAYRFCDFACAVLWSSRCQGGKYGLRFSLGASECEVYENEMIDSFRYGVFFFRGSDEAEVSMWCYRFILASILELASYLSPCSLYFSPRSLVPPGFLDRGRRQWTGMAVRAITSSVTT